MGITILFGTILLGRIAISSCQTDVQSTQSNGGTTTDYVFQAYNGTAPLSESEVNFTLNPTVPLETTIQSTQDSTSATMVMEREMEVNSSTTTTATTTTTTMLTATPTQTTEMLPTATNNSSVDDKSSFFKNRTLDEQMNISISTSATLFSGSLDEQITQTTNFTTAASPASPSTAAEDLQEEQTEEQLNTEHTDGYTNSPENLTQNIISSNVSQNMTTDELEASTTETFAGSNYTNDTQTAITESFHENTTAGGFNNSQSLPDNTADFDNATTVGYIIDNSTMANETSAFNDITSVAPTESGLLPSQSFQNTTFQATSQMPDIVNSTSSHSENVTISSIVRDIINETKNNSVSMQNNDTTNFSGTTKSALNVSNEITVTPTSNLTSPTNFINGNKTVTSTLSTSGLDVGVTNASVNVQDTTVTTESHSVHEHLTTTPPWDDITTGGTTTGGLPGGTVSDGQAGQKSEAVAVAIGVIVALLLVAALVIIFMLVRRRVVHGGKRKHLKDEENVNDFHVELRPPPTKPSRNLSRIADIASHRHRNGTVRPPPEVHDNIALDEYSAPTNKNYFQHGLESEAIKEAMEDLKDYQMGGAGSTVKMRDRPAHPMRAISTKSRISVGPVSMEDDDPSTQHIYDKVYTHNTFKHGK